MLFPMPRARIRRWGDRGLPVLRSTGQTLLARRSRNFIEEAVIREISERA